MANWYCMIQEKQYGPISEEQLRQWIDERRITDKDLVREESSPNWIPLSQSPDLLNSTIPPMQSGTTVVVNNNRPGGLVALSVVNFIMGVIGLFIVMGLFKLVGIGGALVPMVARITLTMRLIEVVLLFVSGFGYMTMRPIAGRLVGNIYACLSIFTTVLAAAILYKDFGILTLMAMLFPIITLILLNTVFRDSFRSGQVDTLPTRSPRREKAAVVLIVVVVLILIGGVIGGSIYTNYASTLTFTNLETSIDSNLLKVAKGNDLEDPYAKNISFPEMKVKLRGDEIRWDVLVQNNGNKRIKYLKVEFNFLDNNGVIVANDDDLLAHDMIFGENNSPILPNSGKWAGGDLDNDRNWKDGRVTVTILELRTD